MQPVTPFSSHLSSSRCFSPIRSFQICGFHSFRPFFFWKQWLPRYQPQQISLTSIWLFSTNLSTIAIHLSVLSNSVYGQMLGTGKDRVHRWDNIENAVWENWLAKRIAGCDEYPRPWWCLHLSRILDQQENQWRIRWGNRRSRSHDRTYDQISCLRLFTNTHKKTGTLGSPHLTIAWP